MAFLDFSFDYIDGVVEFKISKAHKHIDFTNVFNRLLTMD